MRVEIDLFSGRRNPRWGLSHEQAAAFLKLFQAQPRRPGVARPPGGLGYRGIRVIAEQEGQEFAELLVYRGLVSVRRDSQTETWVDEERVLERWLLALSEGHLPEPILARIREPAEAVD